MKAPVALLAVLCVVVGVLPAMTFGPLVHVAATAVLGTAPPPDYHLAIWHGFNLPLLMSAMALAAGGACISRCSRFDLHLHHPRAGRAAALHHG
jgi:multicomponent K+:H+ antiporter subunit A